MRELLEKWAELEPQRCQPAGANFCVVLVNHVWRRVRYDARMVDDRPRVLWAVIEATVAHGWEFILENGPNSDNFSALVFAIQPRPEEEHIKSITALTLDEAALSAYIKALESVS